MVGSIQIEERARELWGSLPIIQEDYIPVIQEALEKQKAIDEADPSDAVIMRVLNAIGYEDESWLPVVKKRLKSKED